METIGTGFRTVGDKLIVRLSSVPKEGSKVYLDDETEIGKLVDIIGPVKSPFGVVVTKCGNECLGKTILA